MDMVTGRDIGRRKTDDLAELPHRLSLWDRLGSNLVSGRHVLANAQATTFKTQSRFQCLRGNQHVVSDM